MGERRQARKPWNITGREGRALAGQNLTTPFGVYPLHSGFIKGNKIGFHQKHTEQETKKM